MLWIGHQFPPPPLKENASLDERRVHRIRSLESRVATLRLELDSARFFMWLGWALHLIIASAAAGAWIW